jgi:hypothetical protein
MVLSAGRLATSRSSRYERTGVDSGARRDKAQKAHFQALLLKRTASSEPPVVSPAL